MLKACAWPARRAGSGRTPPFHDLKSASYGEDGSIRPSQAAGGNSHALSKFGCKLTFGSTPIETLPRLTEHLGGGVELCAKREDCNSGRAFGGNKLRKLEHIVPDAVASGADTPASIGGVQSNHTRMVAAPRR